MSYMYVVDEAIFIMIGYFVYEYINIEYNWRILVIIMGVLWFLSFLSIFYLKESPKFLLS